MNIELLKEHIKCLDIPSDCYSLGRDRNEALCLLHENALWRLYYSEKGMRSNELLFYNEPDACDAFLLHVKHMMNIS